MDTDSFVIYIKTEDFYEDIADYVKNGLTYLTMTKMIKESLGENKTEISFLKKNKLGDNLWDLEQKHMHNKLMMILSIKKAKVT